MPLTKYVARAGLFLTLTQLSYVSAVARTGSFSLAARACNVAQPTLSLQIQKLEQEIGTEIFNRKKNPVKPTHFGQKVVEQARVVLREAEKIEELFRENKDIVSGQLGLGIIPTVATALLPGIYLAMRQRYPQVQLRAFELPTSQCLEKLERGELDVALVATPLKQKNILEMPLYYEPFVAYFPEKQKKKRSPLTIAELEQYEFILLGEEHCFRNQSLKVCKSKNSGQIECGSIDTIKKLVQQGAGMTLLPQLSIGTGDPCSAIFANPKPAREVSLIYEKGFYKKRILKVLRELILEFIPPEFYTRKGKRLIGIDLND